MSFDDADERIENVPREIRCPSCGRPLMALRGPRCPWCGAPVSAEEYAAVAEQSQHVMALPDPTPLPPVTSYAQQSDFPRWGRQWFWGGFLPYPVWQFRPVTPMQTRLRLIVVVIFGILAVVKVGYLLYAMWLLHHVMQATPH